MVDLSTSIGPLKFSLPIFNASGLWCRNKDELEKIAKSKSGAIVFKSYSLHEREGNPEPRLFFTHDYSINSIGLANHGADYYCGVAKDLTHYKKPLIASITSLFPDEYDELLEKTEAAPFDAIEVAPSSPNLGKSTIMGYDLKKTFDIIKRTRARTKKLLGVKLSPYSQRGDIQQVAEGLGEIGVDFVVMTNTFPLSCAIDYEKEVMMIKPNLGIGGLGGKLLKPIALAQTVLFRHFSKGKIPIIGVGGIYTGGDVYEYILAGATAVQVGTSFGAENVAIFDRLEKELTEILKKKGVVKLSDKIGVVKFL